MVRIAAALGLLGSLLAAGCTAHPKQVDESGRVWIENTNLKMLVKVVRQESDRVEGGLLRVRTDLQNKKKENLWVDIQVVWKDAKGFKVYETNWAPLMLPARFTTTHEIVSMKADVADYEYRIRGGAKTAKIR
jgi:uncharacterized protein YcfL